MQTLLATNILAQIRDCYMLQIPIFYRHSKFYYLTDVCFSYEKQRLSLCACVCDAQMCVIRAWVYVLVCGVRGGC